MRINHIVTIPRAEDLTGSGLGFMQNAEMHEWSEYYIFETEKLYK